MTEKAILIAMPMAPHMYGDMDPRKSSIDNRKPWPVMIATSPEGGTGGVEEGVEDCPTSYFTGDTDPLGGGAGPHGMVQAWNQAGADVTGSRMREGGLLQSVRTMETSMLVNI